ncbi:NUDIX hydrolase [Marinicella litoralis]|uniref:Phosphatase NudJ n=1 Tax=Marinicella litoralis TaxID=644220 RepID=A0A4R6XKS3_9GAMM|nr:NUDIX hydrolase [Marinicella litoralis]TDR18504.1 ADP-ribose pyrophosphatase YjhB (NUDIX family) [Marinicella litoralis]
MSRGWLPRVTVAAVIEDDGKFLMVEEDIYGEKILNQPAGHLEQGETLMEAAVRETLEETGWHIEIQHLIEFSQWTSPNSDKHYLRSCFAGKAVSFDPNQQLDDGIIQAIWMTRDEVAENLNRLRSPLVLHHIDHHINGKKTDTDVFSYYD